MGNQDSRLQHEIGEQLNRQKGASLKRLNLDDQKITSIPNSALLKPFQQVTLAFNQLLSIPEDFSTLSNLEKLVLLLFVVVL